MSFGGFGGGGFGQNSQQASTGFGGFGTNTNTTTGFGSTANTGFGANATAPATGGLFGGGAASTGFGGTGFGTGTGFGAAKPAFGATTTTSGGGLFGSTTATAGPSGFGGTGFGTNTAATTTTTPFGGGGATSLFGGAKPATTGFGTGTSAFGGGAATGGSGIFGGGAATTTATGFGATNNPGIGTNVGDPPGTANVAFTATIEKESNNPSQSNAFQNILFMENYKRWSADELRLTDYNQGRRYGSAGGTGAFGGSGFGTSGFGANNAAAPGFGAAATNTGLFGAAPAATGGFGQPAAATTGFGANTGGLFGAAKPAATGGLFGSTAAQPAATGGSLFGGGGGFGAAANTGTTGFGATANNTTGGGLFGGAAAAKPSGFSFGNTGGTGFGAPAATNTGFGANTAATNTGGGLFGAAAQPAATGGSLFGGAQQQQQQPAATGFGGTGFGAQTQNTGGGLFGGAANQQKPGGLFGGTATGNTGTTGSLFGGGATTTNAFGGANNAQQQTGGLFGAKPAATGGLFGATNNTQTNTGGGLFGGGLGATAQQPAQNSLFGGMNNQAKPSLFGGQPAAGGGLFGGQPAQQTGGSLFGNNNQQQAQGGLGNSLMGNAQNNAGQQQSFSTSINDLSAYGSATLFSGLADDKIQNPGPLATPLSVKAKAKSRSILPMYKLSPANASRFNTPQKRGFGFSYSNYGSPSSPSSVASTPGALGQSLLVGSMNRSLSKSISASNLRRSFNPEDSILTPGAFSASTSGRLTGGSSSHKRLVINRDMRSDLFTAPTKETLTPEGLNGIRKLTKRVSFDTSANEGSASKETEQRAIEDVKRPAAEDHGSMKPLPAPMRTNGHSTAPVAGTPEMEQVKGNELAIVHEEDSPASTRSRRPTPAKIEGGTYWMSPPPEQIRAMNRAQLKKVANFVVGRENVGSVAFKVPVDLTGINLDELFDVIVVLEPRSATVYPNAAKKPPVGKGLNVPALISLEQSYPRQGPILSGRKLDRHVQKLMSQKDTTFENYDPETGVWNFSVEHFTTYGLSDDDDDEMDETTTLEVSTGIPAVQAESSPADEDDTFDFKRSRRAVPGAFDMESYSDDEELPGAVQPHRLPTRGLEQTLAPVRSYESDDESMEGAQDYQYEISQHPSGSEDEHDDTMGVSRFAEHDVQVPAGILRARMRAVKKSTAPTKIEVAGGDDWTQILQASVRAPRTVDRARLRALNESGAAWDMKDRGSPAPQKTAPAADSAGFATSIDLMKSLFEQAKGPTQPVQALPAKGFVQWPYQQRAKNENDEVTPMPRPSWGPNQLLVTAHDNETNLQPVDGGNLDSGSFPLAPRTLAQLQQFVDIASDKKGILDEPRPDLKQLAQGDSLWEVASLLFDDNGAGFAAYWKGLVGEATKRALDSASTHEEQAIVCLAGNQVPDACGHLIAARDFRLANLVACIGTQSKDIRNQLKDWRESNVLAEFSAPVRALYELLAGNAGVCAGVKNVPIEHRVASFTISQQFRLDWMQAFGLRLFYTTGKPSGSGADVAEAVRAFQADIEQDREPEPDSPLWTLLKVFASRQFDFADDRLDWLLTRAIHATGKVSFGPDATEKLDRATLAFAATLTAQSHWVPATFVLLQLSEPSSRDAAVRDHLGRHAHLLGSRQKEASAFSQLRRFGVAEPWIWEAKALDFRARGDARQEFLALLWAGNYAEANRAFLDRVGPGLVISRDYARLLRFAQLLYKVRRALPDWERGAVVYLLYPMSRLPSTASAKGAKDGFDDILYDGLVSLRGAAHGDVRQEAAVADMAEELIRFKGGDARLYGLLPDDVRGRYMRNEALAG
ncbi:hypothetical protein QBC39DRAFT_329978 [Podospora conica]|nr:hypothetical protein QBC39DRAFT_329978 [Schizothecium conicum]